MYLGSFNLNDKLTIPITVRGSNGGVSDADANPGYSVFKGETTPAIATGTMAKLNSTTGFYAETITLSTLNGFTSESLYTVFVTVIIGGVTKTMSRIFQVAGVVTVSTKAAPKRTANLMYIEQVTYTEPYGLTLTGGDDQRLSVFLAQRGLPGG